MLRACFLALLTLSVSPSSAQTATQSDPTKVTDPSAFHSPMVVETVFPSDPSLWRDIQSLEGFKPGKSTHHKWFSVPEWYELGKFTCDGVSLREEARKKGTWAEPGLRMKVWRDDEKAKAAIEATFYNPKDNHNKWVTLRFDVLNDEGSIVATDSLTVKAPANASSGNNGNVTFAFSNGTEMRSATKLRLTMTTKDY